MGSSKASKCYHLVAVAYYYWVTDTLFNDVSPAILRDFQPIRDGIVMLLIQLITFWTLVFHGVYFLSALCEDILELASKEEARKKLKGFNNTFFVYLVWPCTFVLVIDFWLLYSVTPRLIEPYHILFDYITWEMNNVIHTYVIGVVVMEAFLTHRPHTRDVASSVRFMAINVAVYLGIVLVTQPFGEIWTYPFVRDMPVWQWPLFFAFNLAVALSSHCAGALLNALFWGRSIITTSDFIGPEEELKKTF